MATSVSLIGLNQGTNEVFKVAFPGGDGLAKAIEDLFNKAFRLELGAMVNPNWISGTPGKDVAVVWGASSAKGMHQRYLHVSYSDNRTW